MEVRSVRLLLRAIGDRRARQAEPPSEPKQMASAAQQWGRAGFQSRVSLDTYWRRGDQQRKKLIVGRRRLRGSHS